MHHDTGNIIAFIGQKGIPKEFPGTSGIEAYVEYKALKFARQGKTVRCYVRNWTTAGTVASYRGIRLIAVPSFNHKFFDALSYSLLASVHASLSGASLCWYQGIGPAFFSFIPKLSGKTVYTTVHSLDWKRKKWGRVGGWFLYICERITVAVSDKIFVVSGNLHKYYI